MTPPKKPANRPGRVQSVAIEGPPPPLEQREMDLLAAYRAMDDEAREFSVNMMADSARDFPRAPRLRLVSVAG